MWSPETPELGSSGIAHYNEDSAPSGTVCFLGKGVILECHNCSKELFRAKNLFALESGYGIDAHRYDQVSHAAGDYAPVS